MKDAFSDRCWRQSPTPPRDDKRPRRNPAWRTGEETSPSSPHHEAYLREAWESLQGVRVLVAEDEFLSAERMRRLLDSLGCVVIGPAATPEAARRLVSLEAVTAAVLDVRLGSETSAELAGELAAQGIAILLVTAEPPEQAPAGYPLLAKPFSPWELARALERAIACGA